jgi:hypothetical protein
MRLTTSPPSCAECHEMWEPKPPGTLWATPGLLRDCFTRKLEKAKQRRAGIVTFANGAPSDVIDRICKGVLYFQMLYCFVVHTYNEMHFMGISCIEFRHNLVRNVVIVAKFYLHPPASVAFVAPGFVKLTTSQQYCVKITGADTQNQSRSTEKCR